MRRGAELSEFCLGLQEPLSGWPSRLAGESLGVGCWQGLRLFSMDLSVDRVGVLMAWGLPSPGVSQETEVNRTGAVVTPIRPSLKVRRQALLRARHHRQL